MTNYVKKSIEKGKATEFRAEHALRTEKHHPATELRHGDWIEQARAELKSKRFTSPLFVLVLIFAALFGGKL